MVAGLIADKLSCVASVRSRSWVAVNTLALYRRERRIVGDGVEELGFGLVCRGRSCWNFPHKSIILNYSMLIVQQPELRGVSLYIKRDSRLEPRIGIDRSVPSGWLIPMYCGGARVKRRFKSW